MHNIVKIILILSATAGLYACQNMSNQANTLIGEENKSSLIPPELNSNGEVPKRS